ncbi:hypothetical protein NLJ89_g9250 [Agrocybe chaxingu]|uniref:Uncharacterized protein n=1 Tax=Agrocybe chaxingu TaxID=84603 RepID=A0A9W8MS05_9AGAR|nr:hypothetical protein NLJ89_g9250 [Agrocybe chaxingu]
MTECPADNPADQNREDEPTENTASTIAIVKLCNKVVDDYRAGLVSKIDALTGIQSILHGHTAADETDSALACLRSYLTVLDNYD